MQEEEKINNKGANLAGTKILRDALWEKTVFLLDVETDDLHDVIPNILTEVDVLKDQKEIIKKALNSIIAKGPSTIEYGVALLNKTVKSLKTPVQVLVRFKEPVSFDSEEEPTCFAWILLSQTKTHPFISNVAEFFQLMHYEWFRKKANKAKDKEDLVNLYQEGLSKALNFELNTKEENNVSGICSGVKTDFLRKSKFWIDDFRAGLNVKVLASMLFMFFACAAPAVAFGALIDVLTEGNIGVIETLISTIVCGFIWSFLGGQPLIILGATGPNTFFTGMLYQLCKHYELPFLGTFFWVGMWTMLFLSISAIFNVSKLMRYFTRFTDETFATLIALIYIVQALRNTSGSLSDPSVATDSGLLTLLLATGTFVIAYILSRFRKTPYLRNSVREFLSDFGPAIAIGIMTYISLLFLDVEIGTLNIPETIQTTKERAWLLDPFTVPSWVYFGAAVPAIFLSILLWINQNIVARLVGSPEHKLKKGDSFHWDILVVAILIGLCSCFGLPWLVASTAVCINHVRSLTIVKDQKIVKTIENRVSNLGVNTLLLGSLFALSLLKVIPMSVLDGMFFYMGIAILSGGNQFVQRLRMWFIDPELLNPTHHFRAVPSKTKHLFTGIQFACLGALWLIKESSFGILFPLFVALLVPVRMLIPRFIEPEYVALLDLEESPEKFQDIGI